MVQRIHYDSCFSHFYIKSINIIHCIRMEEINDDAGYVIEPVADASSAAMMTVVHLPMYVAEDGDDEVISMGLPRDVLDAIHFFLLSRQGPENGGGRFFLYGLEHTVKETSIVLVRLRLFLTTLTRLRTIQRYAKEVDRAVEAMTTNTTSTISETLEGEGSAVVVVESEGTYGMIERLLRLVKPWEDLVINIPMAPDASISVLFGEVKMVARLVDDIAGVLRQKGYK